MASSNCSDSFNQNIKIFIPDGTLFYFLISDIDHWFYCAIRVIINYSIQVGTCLVMFISYIAKEREIDLSDRRPSLVYADRKEQGMTKASTLTTKKTPGTEIDNCPGLAIRSQENKSTSPARFPYSSVLSIDYYISPGLLENLLQINRFR